MIHRTVPFAVGAFFIATEVVRAESPPADEGESPAEARATVRLTFAEAVQRALDRNTSVAVALEEIRVAQARILEARAASFPTFTGTGIYTRLDADRTLNGNITAPDSQLSANLNLTVPLIVPQRWAQWSNAKGNEKAVRASLADVRRQTAIVVARAYLTIVTQKRLIDANETALQTAKSHYDYAHTRLLGGLGNRVDDVRAAQEVATDQAEVESAYAGLTREREALGFLIGDQGPVDTVSDVALAEPPTLGAALQGATTLRADVIAGKTRIDAAERIRKNSYTDYLPFLVGSFQPFYQNPATLTQPQTGWQAQLVLTIPFYDGGLRYGLSDERAALSAETRTQYEGIVRQAKSDVRVAFEAVKRAEAALVASADAARLAHEALDLANLAYHAGATTNIEVIDAERRARDADTSAAVAEDAARQARIDLLAGSGRFP